MEERQRERHSPDRPVNKLPDADASMNAARKFVNPYFLHTLLGPLIGLADDDEAVAEYSQVDPNDGDSVRQIIRALIVPHARTLSEPTRERVKLAYRYYLSKPGVNFEDVFESILPPLDAPDDPRLLFVWIWEECFPGESYHLTDWESYTENPDANEPLQM